MILFLYKLNISIGTDSKLDLIRPWIIIFDITLKKLIKLQMNKQCITIDCIYTHFNKSYNNYVLLKIIRILLIDVLK